MVLNDLKNIGVKDVLVFSTDNLPGFSEAITAIYPKAEIQKCIIHQIRNPTRYVNYKDVRELMKDLKTESWGHLLWLIADSPQNILFQHQVPLILVFFCIPYISA